MMHWEAFGTRDGTFIDVCTCIAGPTYENSPLDDGRHLYDHSKSTSAVSQALVMCHDYGKKQMS